MDFAGGYRSHFSSNMHYNYFSGNGFNLSALISESPENLRNTPAGHYFENPAKKRSSSCPLPTPKMRREYPDSCPVVDEFPDNKLFDFSNSYTLSEDTLHILVTGPPNCGKIRLLEKLAKRSLQLPPNGGPSLAFTQSFAMFGMKIHVNVWYMKNPKECTKSLKDAFSGKNLAIILIYDVTVPKTLFEIREHILGFKRVFGCHVPMILVGNKVDMRNLMLKELSMLDWGLLAHCDGEQLKSDYKLVDFVECSGETGHGVEDMLYKVATVTLRDYFKF